MSCDKYNQYYSDIVDNDGNIIKDKCFDGTSIYKNINDYNINDYFNYKNVEYYEQINREFTRYSFPEDYDKLTYSEICEQTKYSLKPQQKFAGKIFNTHVPNNGILIYHGLGSGKTQTSIVIGEAFKFRNVKEQPIPGRADAHVLIVVPASLTEQYYLEIIGNIDNDEIKSASGQIVINGDRQYYLNRKIRKSLNTLYNNVERLEKNLSNLSNESPDYYKIESDIVNLKKQIFNLKEEENRVVSRVYEIISHEKFLNRLYNNTTSLFEQGEYLNKLKVSNGLLIIDEAHRLVSATGTSYRKLLFGLKYHAHPNFRTVLLTGSPIYDKPYEIGLLLNLLRPRIPFPDGEDRFNEVFLTENMEMKNDKLFRQMCSGYVSYFKGGNPEAYPYKKTIIMNHSMNPYQYSAYKKMLLLEIEKEQSPSINNYNEEFLIRVATSETQSDEVAVSVFNNTRLFSNIVFPEVNQSDKASDSRRTIAEAGLFKFKKVLESVVKNNDSSSPETIKQLIIKTVEEYSSKFAKVAELIERSEGPVFVYSNYVTYGVETMGVIMDSLGYKSFENSQTGSLSKKYFIWKGGKKPEIVSMAKRIFNSMDNKDGSLIKIIFGTQSVMEGVDFKRVRQVHILDPWWNDSRVQQVIARAIRLCSHSGLPEDKRITDVFIHLSTIGSNVSLYYVNYSNEFVKGERIERSSFTTLEPVNKTADSKDWFYNKASIKLKKEGYDILTLKDDGFINASEIINIKKIKDPELTAKLRKFSWKNLDIDSVEEYMYFKSLKKLNINRQFEYSIKQVSLDCFLNKNGNIIRLDEKYLPTDNENIFKLEYENYTTGQKYSRVGIKSKFITNLPDGLLTLQDFFENTAKNSDLYEFKDSSNDSIKLKKSLIIPEGIVCENERYSFSNLPPSITNLTLNKQMIKYLMRMDIKTIKKFLTDVVSEKIPVIDKSLIQKFNQFVSTGALSEKQKIIEKIKKALKITDPDTPWEFESLDNLKKIYKNLNN